MTRSLDSSAKSNEVLRSKLEARTVELERRTEDLRQLRGVAADAALGASQVACVGGVVAWVPMVVVPPALGLSAHFTLVFIFVTFELWPS